MHKLLLSFGDDQRTPFTSAERASIAAYVRGRRRYEEFIQNPDGALTMSERERFEFMIAERDGPADRLSDDFSLLNTTAPKGCFVDYLNGFDVVIGDEASQIPEPVFVAIADRLPEIRHVYIGDVHQLEPHARCPRSSNPAVFGARSVMSALTASARVPVAPLVTTFRAHPSLNELPNRLTYGGTLVSGADAAERRLLLDLFEYPDEDLPFLFVDVAGTFQRAVTKSTSTKWRRRSA
ncbi:hypothetical protein ANCDUO_26184 [Ancylostoma duodenale]|uniref:DNA2/NAM7 helicase-like C-terminal domain-containing protein n=1 Tax=Ancylostoma duodenale TaxID=51022 RepID=A0A0C2F5H8_9BILA|nr:hypothetical protein ANCDUO_26184 [Ancylostoma duodenale]